MTGPSKRTTSVPVHRPVVTKEDEKASAQPLAGAFECVSSGNILELRLLFEALNPDKRVALIQSRSEQSVIIRRPSSSNPVTINKPSLLVYSLCGWYCDVAEFLISHGVGLEDDIDVVDQTSAPASYLNKPLVLVSMLGKLEMVKSVSGKGAYVDSVNSLGDSGLLEACFEGNYTVAEFLVQRGAAVNKQNERGITALMLAAYAGNGEIVDLLLKRGANPHIEDSRGNIFIRKFGETSDYQRRNKIMSHTTPLSNCELAIYIPKWISQRTGKVMSWVVQLEIVDDVLEAWSPNSQVNPVIVFNAFPKQHCRKKLEYCHSDKHSNGQCRFPVDDNLDGLVGFSAGNENLIYGNALFYCVSAGQISMFQTMLQRGIQIDPDMDGMTLLMEAAYEGHLQMVKHLVTNSSDLRININQQDKARRNALFYAFENSQLEVVNYMVSQGAELLPAEHNKTVLMCACLKNNVRVVKFCLKNAERLGLSLNDMDNKGRNTLFYAVTGGSVEILEQLLEAKPSVIISPDGINLLMQAAGKKQLDIGRYILQHREALDIHIDAQDRDGWTALLYSVSARNHEFTKMLVLEGAQSILASDGKTVVMQAAQNGDLELMRYLCDKATMIGLDISSVDKDGWNCLYYCLLGGSIDCMQYMIKQGIKASCNHHQTTLLMEAVDRGEMEFIKLLVELSTSIDLDLTAQDISGCNALFYCAANGSPVIFEYLVNNRVKVSDDNHNRTVLMQSAYNAHKDLVSYLIDNEISLGLDLNQKDKDGRNVLFYCIEGGNLDMLISMLEYGIPMQPDYSGKNNLFQAVSAGHTAIVEFILSNRNVNLKLDPLSTDNNGNNAMYYYAKRPNNKHILSMLMATGLKVNQCSNASNILAHALKSGDLITAKMITGSFSTENKEEVRKVLANWRSARGETLFHWVAMKNDEEFFRLLAPYYDPTTDKDDHNRTPLVSACAQKESESNTVLIKCMLEEAHMDVNAVDIHKHGSLWYALCSENTSAVQLLLQHGAINIEDNYNCSLLMTAAKIGNIINTQYLLNLLPGAFKLLNHTDKYSRNVLHYAAMSGSSEVASLYTRWCPQLLDDVDENECTPLMIASAWGHTQTVANLIRHGANVNMTDDKLRTALHYCVDQSKPSLTTIHLLCRKGRADIDAKDCRGQTTVMIAARRGHLVVAKCLLSHGADPIACDYEALESLDYCKRGDYRMKKLINKFSDMPLIERRCIESKRSEYKEVIDVTRILHMLQKCHIITSQLEAIILADPSFEGRVDRLLDMLMTRGPKAFDVFCAALKEYYPVLAHELMRIHYIQNQREVKG